MSRRVATPLPSPPTPAFWPGLGTLWRWEGAKREKKKEAEEKEKSGPFVASDVLLIL